MEEDIKEIIDQELDSIEDDEEDTSDDIQSLMDLVNQNLDNQKEKDSIN